MTQNRAGLRGFLVRIPKNRRSTLLMASTALVAAAAFAPALAQTWVGADGAAWSVPGNWSGPDVPDTVGEDADFTLGTATQTVVVDGTFTLGSVSLAGDHILSGGTLQLASGVASTSTNSTVSSNIIANGAALGLSSTGQLTLSGAITGSASAATTITANADAGATLTVSGAISDGSGGATSLLKTGDGTVAIDTVAAYSGTTTVSAGTLTLNAALTGTNSVTVDGPATLTTVGADRINDAAGLTVTGTMNLGGAETVASLAGSGSVALGANTLTIGGAATTTFSGILSGSGGLTHSGTGSLTLSGANTYSGTTTVSGGTLRMTNGSVGHVQNSAMFELAGATIASLTQTAGSATLTSGTVSGATTITGGSISNGGATVGTVSIGAGTTYQQTTGTSGAVTNNGGTFTLSGGSASGLSNVSGATTVSGGASVTGATSVTGGSVTNSGGVLAGTTVNTGASFVQNSGSVGDLVSSGGTMTFSGGTANNLTNTSGTTTLSGGTVSNTLISSGTTNVASGSTTVNGQTNVTGGSLTVASGATLDSIVQNEAITTVQGTIANDVTNAAGGTLNLDGTVGALVNSGTTTIGASGGTVNGALTNNGSGTLALTADATVSGDAVLDGEVSFDQASKLTSSGVVTGGGTLNVGGLQLGQTTTVVEGADTSGFTGTLSASNALVAAQVNTGTEIQAVLAANPGLGAVPAAISATQSIISSVVNRPSAALVTPLLAPGDDPCAIGTWARGIGGSAMATYGSSAQSGASSEAEVDLSYRGLQLGIDRSCRGVGGGAWDLAYGITMGINGGSSTTPVSFNGITTSNINSAFDQTYGGIYLSAARGRLFGDLGLRMDNTRFDLDEDLTMAAGGIGLEDQEFDSQGSTLQGSLSYSVTLNEARRLNLTPSAGFSFSNISVDDVSIGQDPTLTSDDLTLEVRDIEQRLGFVGATLSQQMILPGGNSAATYFVTGTYYNEFAGDVTSVLSRDSDGSSTEVTTDALGGYGEVSFGMNYTAIFETGSALAARQLDASVRVDTRFSEETRGSGLTAQVRLQF